MYLNIIQLAESFGVEESVVESWIRNEGLPCVTDRSRLLFDRAQVVAWAAQRGLAARAGFLAAEPGRAGAGCRLEALLRAGGIWRDVSGAGVCQLLETVVSRLPGATPPVRQILAQRLQSADGVSWAPVGGRLALPHLRTPITLGRDSGALAILFLKDALPMVEPPDGAPVTRLLFFVAPSPRAHLELLAQLSSVLSRGNLRQLLLEGAPDEQLLSALAAAEAGSVTGGART